MEGHGESEGQDYLAAISIDDYVKNLHDAIQQIGTPPIVIGHSMGGFVLQQYLTTHTL
ncbi:alpha/beta hydrolase [Paludibacterium denitrificans]|uniref:alpha/beta hydrolase n=1 Tax=Paludibacterium denitrificans TaxID=2675226 RepID=UPI0028A9C143|nr:alpha/beta fold hydrolase [Paludibacterium denitrificans]